MKQAILKPKISESSVELYKKERVATFLVSVDTSKENLKVLFNEIYGFKPEKVNTVITRSIRNVRNKKYRTITKRKFYKKAYFWLGNENKIEAFESFTQ